jgi:hypothetical protein
MGTYGTKFRKAHEQPFERTSLHRQFGAEPIGCGGWCDQGRRECDCQIGLSQTPAPIDPQPVILSKPTLMQRIKAWWAGFKRRHLIDTMENHE